MTNQDQQECERQCVRLCHDFVWLVDACQYDGFVALFAVDGAFERAGQISRGHEAIRQFLAARPAGRVTRHVCTNIRIDMITPDAAKGTCTALMFQAPAGQQTPLPVSTPVVVDYDDLYQLTDSGWKFKHRKIQVIFQ